MKLSFLTAVIVGILFLPIYAQAPEPAGVDTAEQAAEPEVSAKAEEPEQMAEIKSNLEVQDMAFCAGVEEREPISRDTTFGSNVGQIFFWSNVLNSGDEASIEHVWYYNGEEKARVELPANYPRNRVWSSKTILPEWTGEWMVVILAGSGKLGEMTCIVE